MAANTGIYEPLSPPLHRVSPTVQGPYAFLAAEIMVVLSGLVVVAKLHMAVSTYRKFRTNDYAMISALVLALGYTAAICTATQHGLGTSASALPNSEVQDLSESYYASNILLFLCLGTSKSAVALLIISIQPRRWVVVGAYALLAVSVTWTLASVFVVALQCSPTRWVLGPTGVDTCIDQYGAQIAIRALDIVTDVALALLPALMMAGVQTTTYKRMIVSFMFGVRLITPIFTAVSIASLRSFYNAPTSDRPFAAVQPSIWTSLAMNMSLITACVPSIKRLMNDYKAGMVNAGIMEPYEIQQTSVDLGRGRGDTPRDYRKSPYRSHDWPSSNRGKESRDNKYAVRAGDSQVRVDSDRDSEVRLTDGIMQTTDFRIDYNES